MTRRVCGACGEKKPFSPRTWGIRVLKAKELALGRIEVMCPICPACIAKEILAKNEAKAHA